MMNKDKAVLEEYLPVAAIEQVYFWIVHYKIRLKITRNRRTKLGDYRPPIQHPNHRISINYDLNPYAFLITFVHELAHLQVFEAYKNKVRPHGKEWKTSYRQLMEEILKTDVFPPDIHQAISNSIVNAKASSTSELELSRALMQYDKENSIIHVEDLPLHSLFQTENGRQFRKGEKQRSRYKCLNLQNNRLYLVHPLTPVVEAE